MKLQSLQAAAPTPSFSLTDVDICFTESSRGAQLPGPTFISQNEMEAGMSAFAALLHHSAGEKNGHLLPTIVKYEFTNCLLDVAHV